MKRLRYEIVHQVFTNYSYITAKDKNGCTLGMLYIDLNCGQYPRYRSFCNGEKLATLVRVETLPHYVGNGIASTLIRYAIKELSDYNIVLLCAPQHRSENTDTLKTVSDLKKFYEKFGFRKTGELIPTMIRKATLPTSRV